MRAYYILVNRVCVFFKRGCRLRAWRHEGLCPRASLSGVPARRIGWMSRVGEKLGPDLQCPRTGERYRETPEGHLEIIQK